MNEPIVSRASFKQNHRRSRSESSAAHEAIYQKLTNAPPFDTAPPLPHSYMTSANRVFKVLDHEISGAKDLVVRDARKLASEMRQQFSPSLKKKSSFKDMKLVQSYYQDSNENVLAFDNLGVFNYADEESTEESVDRRQAGEQQDNKRAKADVLLNEMQDVCLDSDSESKSSQVGDKFVAFLRKKGLNLRRSSANSLYNELDEDEAPISPLSHVNDLSYSNEHTNSLPTSFRARDSFFKKINLKKKR